MTPTEDALYRRLLQGPCTAEQLRDAVDPFLELASVRVYLSRVRRKLSIQRITCDGGMYWLEFK